jgi:hypothetical protein
LLTGCLHQIALLVSLLTGSKGLRRADQTSTLAGSDDRHHQGKALGWPVKRAGRRG